MVSFHYIHTEDIKFILDEVKVISIINNGNQDTILILLLTPLIPILILHVIRLLSPDIYTDILPDIIVAKFSIM